MGTSRKVRFAIHSREWAVNKGVWLSATPVAWPSRYLGKPTSHSLEQWVEDYEDSTQPGGVNERLGEVHVVEATVKDHTTGRVVAHYKAPAFKVMRSRKFHGPPMPSRDPRELRAGESVSEAYKRLNVSKSLADFEREHSVALRLARGR